MIKEVCSAIKAKLMQGEPLKLIDTFSGMVQTVTYKEQNSDGNPITKRMPVSYDTNIAKCVGTIERDLVPDSSKKGLLYFEENGRFQVVKELSAGRRMHRGSVLLVCWMNRRKSVGDNYTEVTKLAYDEIVSKLYGVIPSDIFINLKVKPAAFRQDSAIFARYTYEETTMQYLRPPFEFFAIDLTVSFVIGCAKEITLNPKNC